LGPLEDVVLKVRQWPSRWQNKDGGFPTDDEGTPSCAWTTAGLLWALAESGEHLNQQYIQRALDYLIKNQNYDGGNPTVKQKDLSVTDSTALFVCAISHLVEQYHDTKVIEALIRAVDWLLKSRGQGEAWRFTGTEDKCYVSSTSFAVLALHEAASHLPEQKKRETSNAIKEVTTWLLGIRNGDGGWGQFKGSTSRPAQTAMALWALEESGLIGEDQLRQSVAYLVNCQREDGSWGDSMERPSEHTVNRFGTPYALIALIRHGTDFDISPMQKGIQSLLRSYEPERGCFHFGDTDIRSWPTRDCLLALSYVTTRLGWSHIHQLMQQRDQLEQRVKTLEQSESERLGALIKRNAPIFTLFKWTTCIMLGIVFALAIWVSYRLLGMSEILTGVVASVAAAIWSFAAAGIVSRRLSSK